MRGAEHTQQGSHISRLGPTVYCIALLPLEGHWLFCCITDRNLVWEASKRHLSCNTRKKRPLYVCWQLVDPYQHLWAECECLWFCGSWVWKHLRESRGRLNFLRASFIPLFLLSFPNSNSSTMTQPVLHSPAFCGSTVWTQHVDWPAQTAKDGRKNVRFFFFFFFSKALTLKAYRSY